MRPPQQTARPWRWGVWHAEDDAWLAELQQRNAQRKPPGDKAGETTSGRRIPKRIHQIWLGPTAIPSRCEAWRKTWREHHPLWEYKLWRDEDASGFQLKNEKAFREASNYGEKSDILRYEILAREGGVYVDIDMECLRPFDSLLEEGAAFIVGMSNTACVEINNAVVASCSGHPILLRLIDAIYETSRRPRLDAAMLARIAMMGGDDVAQQLTSGGGMPSAMDTIERTGPGLMTRTFMEAIGWTSTKPPGTRHEGFLSTEDRDLVVALPVEVLYPLSNNNREQLRPLVIPSQAMAVHYWQCSWME